jgi:hypothetical protein
VAEHEIIVGLVRGSLVVPIQFAREPGGHVGVAHSAAEQRRNLALVKEAISWDWSTRGAVRSAPGLCHATPHRCRARRFERTRRLAAIENREAQRLVDVPHRAALRCGVLAGLQGAQDVADPVLGAANVAGRQNDDERVAASSPAGERCRRPGEGSRAGGQRDAAAVSRGPELRTVAMSLVIEGAVRAVVARHGLEEVVGAVAVDGLVGLLGLDRRPSQVPLREPGGELAAEDGVDGGDADIDLAATVVGRPVHHLRRDLRLVDGRHGIGCRGIFVRQCSKCGVLRPGS